MFSKKLIVSCMVLACAAPTAPAAAHGDVQATNPAPVSSVRRAPRSVAVTFTEAPTRQAVLEVTDGCKRNVGQGVEVDGVTATVRVATGQPGKWRVSYNVISAVDGHETRGGYAFTVAGGKDCTPDEATAAPDDDSTQAGAPAQDLLPDEEGSGPPLVPIALGAAALIAVALFLRRSGSA